MRIEKAKRIVELPPYLFAAIDKKKGEMRKKGMDLIDFGIGDPDLPTPAPIIERLKEAAGNPIHHR
jgi:LL-diaminopimelate aminotransferase